MVKFVADSACDLKEYPGINFETVPLSISTDERNYVDTPDLDVHEVLDYMAGYHHRSFTACPATQLWLDAFEGADEIYVATITSGLSGTYQGANVAKDIYLSEHPEAKICVVDSLSTGPGEVLLLEKMVEWKNEGKSFEYISEEIINYRNSTRLFFGLASLHNLAQNGRVPKLVASAIGIMNIRILGTASETGTIEPIAKCRGDKKVLQKLMEVIKEAGYKGGKVRICHIENETFSDQIIEAVRQEFGEVDIKSIPARGLCSYYAERGGIIFGCECQKA